METRDRAKAILSSGRKTNRPHPDEPGMRIVGWIVPDDDAGLSDAIFALDDITSAATAHFKSD